MYLDTLLTQQIIISLIMFYVYLSAEVELSTTGYWNISNIQQLVKMTDMF